MLEQIKRAAAQTGDAAVPVRIMFGTVASTGPLSVLVDSRFLIGEQALIVPRELMGHVHRVPADVTGEAAEHSHAIPRAETETEPGGGLKEGDRVILLRNHGGQEYLVLGRCL